MAEMYREQASSKTRSTEVARRQVTLPSGNTYAACQAAGLHMRLVPVWGPPGADLKTYGQQRACLNSVCSCTLCQASNMQSGEICSKG